MSNPMDKFQFQSNVIPQQNFQNQDMASILNQARQNPREFEEHVKRTNPQAYQRALQIRNSVANPQQAVMQVMQQKGLNPNILRMLDI